MNRINVISKKLYKIGLVVSLAIFLLFIFYDIHNLESNSKRYLSDHYISEGVQETGAINIVTSVLYDYRAFDTLGEATVLLTAAAILSFLVPITKDKMRGTPFTIIVSQTTQVFIPFLAILGMYLIFFGHLAPGGGFVGGVVIALIPILLTITYRVEFSEYKFKPDKKKVSEDIGAIGFVLIGLLGILTGSNFLANGQANVSLGDAGELISAGLIPYLNIMIGIKVGAGLAIIFNSLIKEK
ncbi:putative monovalent cation/H+ antiporter subunit B [Paraliobacillus sp. PM-2]|uniref:hydrogen gas-evolving membrane-bound hydrogenase subunit E n=1 Tax=Paraliobacillus sp. PM-2 TaxID=1462524 RepID=UPI00061BB6E4|nr:hydrogen gas-evolving membrane-bound hydrogenase subunit E [Paraliobacillus sp. PM-2]CQR48038.1 putative monovalent cation/H+ antiporter subunit B [Paraliobacillus sp. PM-2]